MPDAIRYYYDQTTSSNPIGRLTKATDASGQTVFRYDKRGRVTKTVKTVDAVNYTTNFTYDGISRITSIKYLGTSPETVSYTYNGVMLSQVTGSNPAPYASYTNYNALGQPGNITYGNGVATSYQYYPLNNRLQSIVTGNIDQKLIDLTYNYYPGGSVKDIVDKVNYERNQSFQYDGLDRIQQAQSGGYGVQGGVLWYDYTPIGNIKLKEGVTYDYTGLKPHAVKSTSNGMSYAYDDNGNMTSDGLRTIAYDYDNMPQSITVNNAVTSFTYDGSGSRVKKIGPFGENIYLGKLYECKEGVCTKYIFAGGARIAMKTGNDVLYYHQDHLGSTQAVTQTGAIQDNLCAQQPVRIAGAMPQYFPTLQAAYDAASDGDVIQARAVNFGSVDSPVSLNLNKGISVTLSGGYDCGYTTQLENSELVGMITGDAGKATIGNFEIVITGYGKHLVDLVRYRPFGETLLDVGILTVNHKYTAQEYDDETGLYNYNARFYNPALGRLISADIIVSDPFSSQALNRYSYVLNNPHSYIDPSGYEGDTWDSSYESWDWLELYSTPDWGQSYLPTYDNYNYFNYYDQISSPSYSSNPWSGPDLFSNTSNSGGSGSINNASYSENAGGNSSPVIVTVNYWPSAWGSFTMVWHDSLLPSFYRMGTLGSNGKIALPGIYRYQYGQHPMTPTKDPATGKLKVPYPALNVYNPLYRLFGYDNDRIMPALNLDKFGFDTINGQNVHRGNSRNNPACGGAGCHVLPMETWDEFINIFPPGSSGLYINLGL